MIFNLSPVSKLTEEQIEIGMTNLSPIAQDTVREVFSVREPSIIAMQEGLTILHGVLRMEYISAVKDTPDLVLSKRKRVGIPANSQFTRNLARLLTENNWEVIYN